MWSVCNPERAHAARVASLSLERRRKVQAWVRHVRRIAAVTMALSLLALMLRIEALALAEEAGTIVLLALVAFCAGLLIGLEITRQFEPRRTSRILGLRQIAKPVSGTQTSSRQATILTRGDQSPAKTAARRRRRTPRRPPRIIRQVYAF